MTIQISFLFLRIGFFTEPDKTCGCNQCLNGCQIRPRQTNKRYFDMYMYLLYRSMKIG